MIGPGRRAKIALATLAVAALGGLAAGTASATSTTAVTCVATPAGGGFTDSHCTVPVTDGAHFLHRGFSGSLAITISNGGIPAEFKASILGVTTKLVCTTVTGTGSIENFAGVGTIEMSAKGTAELTFSGCTLTPFSGCTVSGGSFTTKPLSFGTGGMGMAVNVFATVPSLLAEVPVDGCSPSGLDGTWPIEGTIAFTPHGTTETSTHNEVTGQSTLTFHGNRAGLTSSLIIEGPLNQGIAFTT